MAGEAGTEKKSFLESIETASKILGNIGGILVPIAIAYAGYVLSESSHAREIQEKRIDWMFKVMEVTKNGPDQVAYLKTFDEVFGDNDDPYLKKVITRAWETMMIAGTKAPTKEEREHVQAVVANNAPESMIKEAVKSTIAEVRDEAQKILQGNYNVVIQSTTDQSSAEVAAKQANDHFKGVHSNLSAKALAPGHSTYWGVYIGEGVGLDEARSLIQQAKKLGYSDAYAVRF